MGFYVVVEPRHTTTRVKRLADGFESVYGNADLKKFDSTSPLFAQVPPEVSRVLVHGFKNLFLSVHTRKLTERERASWPVCSSA